MENRVIGPSGEVNCGGNRLSAVSSWPAEVLEPVQIEKPWFSLHPITDSF